MSFFTTEELAQALVIAEQQRNAGEDPDHIAHALLVYHRRYLEMLPVITAIKHYLHAGTSATEHSRLIKAMEHWEHYCQQEAEGRVEFGQPNAASGE